MNQLLERIEERLGTGGLFTDAADRAAYEEGWRYGRGQAMAVARPRTSEEVAWLLAESKASGVRVQPIGANTGLVGASTPDDTGRQLVISLERLTPEIEVDVHARTVVVGAGTTLSALNQALEPHGLMLPIDLGADPQVGGMIATNTGGTRLLRYGAMRRYVLGLEVALADGRVYENLAGLWKDSRGLRLEELFVGTTGALGIVTRATLAVVPKPNQTATAWVALSRARVADDLLVHLERHAHEFLSAFEVLSAEAVRSTLEHGRNFESPFIEGVPERAVLVELSTTLGRSHLDLEDFLFETLATFVEEREDGVDEVYPAKPHDAWELRHQVSESLRHEGRILALDVSVPRGQVARFTQTVTQLITEHDARVRVADFGHWGDGGTHLNLVLDPATHTDADAKALQELVYEHVAEYDGSFSAEHGIGPHNLARYGAESPDLKLELSRVLADHLDPERRLGNVRLEGTRS